MFIIKTFKIKLPFNFISPLFVATSPIIVFINVDFPTPFLPIMASISLCLTSIPLWFLCKAKEINDRNSVLIILCWLFQPVVFNINLFDFHPEVWAMPLLVLFYLF